MGTYFSAMAPTTGNWTRAPLACSARTRPTTHAMNHNAYQTNKSGVNSPSVTADRMMRIM